MSTAAHALDHGFEVVIFEAEKDVGGVWARCVASRFLFRPSSLTSPLSHLPLPPSLPPTHPPRRHVRSENSTSQLQLNSILYRFHPSVKWNSGFPKRDEIISQIRAVWHRYDLQKRTRFNVRPLPLSTSS